MEKRWVVLGIFIGLLMSAKGVLAADQSFQIDPKLQRMCVKQTEDNRNGIVKKYVVCLGYTADKDRNADIQVASISGKKANAFFSINEPSDLCHHLGYRKARVHYDLGQEVIYHRVHDDNAFEDATANTSVGNYAFWYQEEGVDEGYYPITKLECVDPVN